MSENPFESPTTTTAIANADQASSVPANRPLGITILAVLHSLSGFLFLLGFSFLFTETVHDTSINGIAIRPVLAMAWVTTLAVLFICSGVGMAWGATWAWWIATIYYWLSLLSIVIQLGFNVLNSIGMGNFVSFHLTQSGVPLVVLGSLLGYCFRTNVLAYFRLDSWSKKKLFGVLLAAAIACYVLIMIATYGMEILLQSRPNG